jgi:hypothetical protein
MQILYLSTSMGSKISKNVTFFVDVHQSIPCMPHVSSVSTLVEPSSTSLQCTSVDVVYVNHTSCSHIVDNGFTPSFSTPLSSSMGSHIQSFILMKTSWSPLLCQITLGMICIIISTFYHSSLVPLTNTLLNQKILSPTAKSIGSRI